MSDSRPLPATQDERPGTGSDQTRNATLTTADSRELLARLQAGDDRAADQLFKRYLPLLHRWAHRRMPNWARGILDTGDVVQDAVLHTLKNIGRFQPQCEGALLGYLRRVLINRIRDQFRHVARHPTPSELDDSHVSSTASPLEMALSRETHAHYVRALACLKAADRNAIVARLVLGYSYEQLALVLGKPTAEAARLAVRRALLRLAREMQRV